MNWVDAVLIVLLLASVVVGSKKGLIRELMAFVIFFVAIIFSVNYIDNFAVWVYDKIGGSPLISAFLSFLILLALSYAAFKLFGLMFYKVANLKNNQRRDQLGGALVGFLRGWVAVGFLTFLLFLLPLPERFYSEFENSFFGPAVAKTVPLMFEGTSRFHPSNADFMDQMERTLLGETISSDSKTGIMNDDRQQAYRVLYRLEKYFKTGLSET